MQPFFIAGILTILLLLFFLAMLPLYLKIHYQRRNFDDLVILKILLWKLPLYKLAVPTIDLKVNFLGIGIKLNKTVEKRSGIPQMLIKIIKAACHYHRSAGKYLLMYTHCQEMRWCTKIGVGDAANTGRITGLVWIVKTVLISWLSHLVRPLPAFRHPVLEVQPNFTKQELSIDLDCILKVRLGYIIIAGIKILFCKIHLFKKKFIF